MHLTPFFMSSKNTITVLYMPGRERSYARTSIFIIGMKKIGINLIDCSSQNKSNIRYLEVLFKFFKNKNRADIILVGFLGQHLMPIVKLFAKKNQKIIFDAFLSTYDTMVFDKKKVKESSYLAKLFWWLDKKSSMLADVVLLDTFQHINYFSETFNISKSKFRRVLIGADDTFFYPKKTTEIIESTTDNKNIQKNNKFIVEFHGYFIPLQGVEYIIRTAKILQNEKDILFKLIGDGQTFEYCKKLANDLNLHNVLFLGKQPYHQIPSYIAECDIGLGIFGSSMKTQRVIPNKAYEIIAMNKPLITADTLATAELFEHKKHAYLCKPKDPASIANAILLLKNDKILRNKIANNGYSLFKEKCSTETIGTELKKIIERLSHS